MGRPERNNIRITATRQLGNGLFAAEHHEDALTVREAELAIKRRVGGSEESILIAQSNLANTYDALRRPDALILRRDVYSGFLKLFGEEKILTIGAAYNYALSLINLQRFEETRALLCKPLLVARRVLGGA